MRTNLETECSDIQEHSTYTAEAHYIDAAKQKRLGNILQIAPAVVAAVLGVLAGTDVWTPWTLWLTVIAAAISAVSNVLNPFAEYYSHLDAGKAFTVLKHDARALKSAFAPTMTDDTFAAEVRALHNRYTAVVRSTPPTSAKSFAKAQANVKKGTHERD